MQIIFIRQEYLKPYKYVQIILAGLVVRAVS